jgi:hypothetical protein
VAYSHRPPCAAPNSGHNRFPGNLVGRSLTDVLDGLPLCFNVVAATAPDGCDIYNGDNINTTG